VFNQKEVSNLLAMRVTNEEEEEVLEELEQLHQEALGLPEAPIHLLPQKEPEVVGDMVTERDREGEREAIPV
jgi:hypothetical protein